MPSTKYEKMITELIDRNFGIANDFISEKTLDGLRHNLLTFYENGEMHVAGVGRKFDFQKNTTIRGDVIRWIEKDTQDPFERQFLNEVEGFVDYLNETCYTGINDYEFHYAFYDVNSFYKRHRDQFKSDRGRKYSLVTYLNDNWQLEDHGYLSLYLDPLHAKIFPKGGRAVFFKSDMVDHEVHPSPNRPRLSIAGWLKKSEV